MAALAAQPADAVIAEPVSLGAAFLLEHPRPARPAVVMCGIIPLPHREPRHRTLWHGAAARPVPQPSTKHPAGQAVNRRILRQPFQVINDLHTEVHGADMADHVDGLGPSRRGVRPVHRSLVRIPVVRRAGHAAIRRTAVGDAGHRRRCRRGGPISTEPGPSFTSPRAPSPIPTTAKPSNRRCVRSPTRMSWSPVATGGRPSGKPAHAARQRPCRRPSCPTTNYCSRTSVYVTNGGYGGVQYALRHGVPIVAAGGKEDKPEVGARVAWSGVGRRIRTEHPTPMRCAGTSSPS